MQKFGKELTKSVENNSKTKFWKTIKKQIFASKNRR